jgi:hypothetical protein
VEQLTIHNRNWKKIARAIPTRSLMQIRTHAQKYFLALENHKKKAAAARERQAALYNHAGSIIKKKRAEVALLPQFKYLQNEQQPPAPPTSTSSTPELMEDPLQDVMNAWHCGVDDDDDVFANGVAACWGIEQQQQNTDSTDCEDSASKCSPSPPSPRHAQLSTLFDMGGRGN